MNIEGEAVAFCPRASGLDWGIGFERAGLQQRYMHFTSERSPYCRNEQKHEFIEEHLVAESRSYDGSRPDFHQSDMRASKEENNCHQKEQQVSRFDAAAYGTYDSPKFCHLKAERSSDNQDEHRHNCKCQFEVQHEQHEMDWKRRYLVVSGCCVVNTPNECIEDGSPRGLVEPENPPFSLESWKFPVSIMANSSRLVVGYALTAKKAESFVKPALVARARYMV